MDAQGFGVADVWRTAASKDIVAASGPRSDRSITVSRRPLIIRLSRSPSVSRLGVDPLSRRDLDPDFAVAVRDEHRLKLLWDREIQAFDHFLHGPVKLPRGHYRVQASLLR
jgi:hypothetical protein